MANRAGVVALEVASRYGSIVLRKPSMNSKELAYVSEIASIPLVALLALGGSLGNSNFSLVRKSELFRLLDNHEMTDVCIKLCIISFGSIDDKPTILNRDMVKNLNDMVTAIIRIGKGENVPSECLLRVANFLDAFNENLVMYYM